MLGSLKVFQFLTWQLCSQVSVAVGQGQSHRAFYDEMNAIAISQWCHSYDRHSRHKSQAFLFLLFWGLEFAGLAMGRACSLCTSFPGLQMASSGFSHAHTLELQSCVSLLHFLTRTQNRWVRIPAEDLSLTPPVSRYSPIMVQAPSFLRKMGRLKLPI